MEPLRILQISYDMSLGGAETLIMSIYRNIDRSKVQFDFLLHSDTESAYEKEILKLGGRIFRIPRYTGLNRLSYEKNLKRFLTEHPEYTIIHDHLMDSASETLRVAKSLGLITIAHSHTADVPFSLSEFVRFFFRRNLWKIADHRFACSDEAGKWLYRGKAPYTVLRNGIITEQFRYSDESRKRERKELGVEESTKLIGTVGRLVTYKNHVRLLEIMKSIAGLDNDTMLIIVGEGEQEGNLRSTAKRLGLENKVIFTGPRTDVNELLSAMDAFALTSLYEGLGIVLVEAQASGLPCIFTDTIPKDVDLIPELVHRVSLSDSNEKWANTILNCKPLECRDNAWILVADKGYDISTSAKQLQEFYLGLSEDKCASV